MNEIIALNGDPLLNPSGIPKSLHVQTQGVGIRLNPVLSCMDPAGINNRRTAIELIHHSAIKWN